MANVNIKFNNKEYLLSCEDGQEEHLEELSLNLNKKFNNLKYELGNIGENKLLLISSIKVMDEYYETKKKVQLQKKELEEQNLKTVILLNPLNEEAILNIAKLKLDSSDYKKSKELNDRLISLCTKFCKQSQKLKKEIENLSKK